MTLGKSGGPGDRPGAAGRFIPRADRPDSYSAAHARAIGATIAFFATMASISAAV